MGRPRAGFVGLGNQGRPIAANLVGGGVFQLMARLDGVDDPGRR